MEYDRSVSWLSEHLSKGKSSVEIGTVSALALHLFLATAISLI